MSVPFKALCLCDSFECSIWVEVPFDEAQAVEQGGLVLIARSCRVGPNPTDVLVEERELYSLYRD